MGWGVGGGLFCAHLEPTFKPLKIMNKVSFLVSAGACGYLGHLQQLLKSITLPLCGHENLHSVLISMTKHQYKTFPLNLTVRLLANDVTLMTVPRFGLNDQTFKRKCKQHLSTHISFFSHLCLFVLQSFLSLVCVSWKECVLAGKHEEKGEKTTVPPLK